MTASHIYGGAKQHSSFKHVESFPWYQIPFRFKQSIAISNPTASSSLLLRLLKYLTFLEEDSAAYCVHSSTLAFQTVGNPSTRAAIGFKQVRKLLREHWQSKIEVVQALKGAPPNVSPHSHWAGKALLEQQQNHCHIGLRSVRTSVRPSSLSRREKDSAGRTAVELGYTVQRGTSTPKGFAIPL